MAGGSLREIQHADFTYMESFIRGNKEKGAEEKRGSRRKEEKKRQERRKKGGTDVTSWNREGESGWGSFL